MHFEDKSDNYVATVYGIQVQIPRWAKFIAVNQDGRVGIYSLKPLIDSESGYWVADRQSRWDFLSIQAHFDQGENWMSTLCELEDIHWLPKLDKQN